jgi:hypothetical protein
VRICGCDPKSASFFFKNRAANPWIEVRATPAGQRIVFSQKGIAHRNKLLLKEREKRW